MNKEDNKQRYASEAGLFYLLNESAFLQRDEFDLWESSKKYMDIINKCNLYFICHRTRIGVKPDSMEVTLDSIKIYFEYWEGVERYSFPIEFPNTFGLDICMELNTTCNFFKIKNKIGKTLYEAKATYFVDDFKHNLMPRPKFMDLKVLYIGQALDKSDKPILNRLIKHETLLKIYSETPIDKEVFLILYPLYNVDGYIEIKNSVLSQSKHILKDNERLEAFIESKLQLTFKQHINIAEAAFIKYFQPAYNKQHKKTFPKQHKTSYEELYKMDYNTIGITLDQRKMDYYFYSDTILSSPLHNYSFFLPTEKDRRKLFEGFL